MTFKDLQKFVEYQFHHNQITSPPELQPPHLFTRLRDKPFWIWTRIKHEERYRLHGPENCCFNHVVGLPKKDGIEKPLFDYQRLLYDASRSKIP